MKNLKDYLNERRKFLQEVANADASEDSLTVLGQIHEIKVILNWIDEHETPADAHTNTPKTYADGYDADAIAKALENPKEA